MKTWASLDSDLDLFLGDADRTAYPEPLRRSAYNRAAEYFASTHTAVFRSVTATGSSYAEGTIVAYPSDLVELPRGGVSVLNADTSSSYFLQNTEQIIPGQQVDTGGVYVELGDGIYLPGKQTTVTLWYYASYTPVADATTPVTVPQWADWAVLNLAMAYLLYPGMMNQQTLRQFQTRRDAGQPEDNPPRAQAKFCLDIYFQVVGNVAPQERTIPLVGVF